MWKRYSCSSECFLNSMDSFILTNLFPFNLCVQWFTFPCLSLCWSILISVMEGLFLKGCFPVFPSLLSLLFISLRIHLLLQPERLWGVPLIPILYFTGNCCINILAAVILGACVNIEMLDDVYSSEYLVTFFSCDTFYNFLTFSIILCDCEISLKLFAGKWWVFLD